MLIKFVRPFKSIRSFSDIEVKKIVIVTGINGSGKTHLLEALISGSLDVGIPKEKLQSTVKMINIASLTPRPIGSLDYGSIKGFNNQLYSQYVSFLDSSGISNQFEELFQGYKINLKDLGGLSAIVALSKADRESLVPDRQAEEFENDFQRIYNSSLEKFSQYHQSSYSYENLAARNNKCVLDLSRSDFIDMSTPCWKEVDVFSNSFAHLFGSYLIAQEENKYNEYLNVVKGDQGVRFLTNEEFLNKNGRPPWVAVNELFDRCHFDFEFVRSGSDRIDHRFGTIDFHLTKKSTGEQIQITDLSSGEKIIISFIFAYFGSIDDRHSMKVPSLLLIDEVDAVLHPAMIKMFLNIINSIIASFDTTVFVVTHSASTVALAEDGSIYLMSREVGGLKPISKNQAIDALTAGVPTLSLSYDGRRQVFAESDFDTRAYDALYNVLKPRLNSEISLEFVSTGIVDKSNQDVNTGKDIVKSIVNQMQRGGNKSVFGIIDHDLINYSTDRVKVLAEGRRYSIENLIFDPLAVGLFVAKHFDSRRHIVGIPNDVRFSALTAADATIFQDMVTKIGEVVFGDEPVDITQSIYISGLSLNVDVRFLINNGHKLEEDVLRNLPFLMETVKTRGGVGRRDLKMRFIYDVYCDLPEFVPLDIFNTLTWLLER